MIRPMNRDDVNQLFLMRADGKENPQQIEKSRTALEVLFPRIFFDHPWRNGDITSLLSEDPDGHVNGTIGVINRPMNWQGKLINTAVCSDLYVEPASRSKMVGLQLLKVFLNGPQELSVADVANENTRRIWERLGGIVVPLYGLNWLRIFQPAQFALSIINRKQAFHSLKFITVPCGKIVDALLDRVLKLKSATSTVDPNLNSKQLTPELFARNFDMLTAPNPLSPSYDPESMNWLWNRLDYIARDAGPSRQVLVEDSDQNVLGWYIYQVKQGGIGRVAQIVASQRTIDVILQHLFADAVEHGAVGVMGRLQPNFLRSFLDHDCLLRTRDSYTLVHSRDPDLMQVFEQGQAFLTLLEGEACLDIWNDPKQAAERLAPFAANADVNETEIQTVG